jgi:hypothetical protein
LIKETGLSDITGQTCKLTTCEPTQPKESVAEIVKLVAGLAAAVGVPAITPVEAVNVRPAGKEPEARLKR